MSFLRNMPSIKADSFALLLSSDSGSRPRRNKSPTTFEYFALNDTHPPEGQVIGMCPGFSVLSPHKAVAPAEKRGLKRPAPSGRDSSSAAPRLGWVKHGISRTLEGSAQGRDSNLPSSVPAPAAKDRAEAETEMESRKLRRSEGWNDSFEGMDCQQDESTG